MPPPPQRRGQPSTVRFGFCFFEAMGSKLPRQAGFQGMAPHTAPQHPPEHPKARRGQGNPDGRHPASSILLKAGKKKNHTADLPNSLPAPRGEQGASTSCFLVF